MQSDVEMAREARGKSSAMARVGRGKATQQRVQFSPIGGGTVGKDARAGDAAAAEALQDT